MKIKQKFIAAFLALFCLGAVSACGGSNASSESSSSSSEETSSSISSEASSESSSTSHVIGDSDWIYYAEDLYCKLTLDFTNRSFWTDGIEKVSLYNCVDGDTAHFTTSTGEVLKARFYGIDTPESTGSVQEYGKQASDYTKSILTEAEENGCIVVSSAQYQYGTPNADSTGSRYVSLVWVSLDNPNATYDQLMLLNLMIVEYGYSWVKNVADMETYVDTFYAAQNQAVTYKLKLFSGEPDPRFNYGDYEDVSLLELKNEIIACINDPTRTNKYDNAKVRVQGTIAGHANNILYLEDFCFYTDDAGEPIYKDGTANPDYKMIIGETGEYAGINIFTGMSSISSKFRTVGNYIQVAALGADTESYGFQLTDGSFPIVAYDDNDAQVLITADKNTEEHALHTFEFTADELEEVVTSSDDSVKYQALNCRVSITDEAGVEINDGYDGTSGIYLYPNYSWGTFHTFSYKPYGSGSSISWTSYQSFVGHKFHFTGCLAIHITTSGKLRLDLYIPQTSDIVWVDTDATSSSASII